MVITPKNDADSIAFKRRSYCIRNWTVFRGLSAGHKINARTTAIAAINYPEAINLREQVIKGTLGSCILNEPLH